MAQLVARLNGIQKVRGSNPLGSTNRYPSAPVTFRLARMGLFYNLSVQQSLSSIENLLEVCDKFWICFFENTALFGR